MSRNHLLQRWQSFTTMKYKEKIIIDAHNLMHKMPAIKAALKNDLLRARLMLLASIAEIADKRKNALFIVVFDGVAQGAESTKPNVRIIKSGRDAEADKEIFKLIATSRYCKTTVVSSDAEIINFAKNNATYAISAEEFIRELNSLSKKSREKEKPAFGGKSGAKVLKSEFENASLDPNDLNYYIQYSQTTRDKVSKMTKPQADVPETPQKQMKSAKHAMSRTDLKPKNSTKAEIEEFKKLFED